MIEKPYTHVGLVTPDLEKTMYTLGRAMDLSWAKILSWEIEIWSPTGNLTVQSTFSYAMGDTPSIELLQEVPGTVWTVGSDTAHHIGYWSTDMPADAAVLADRGYSMITTLAGPTDGPTGFSYHQGPDGGPLIELVDASLKRRFHRWWAGERF